MIVVDETGFVKPTLFVKVIAPLQLIDEACMVTLTTHSDKSEAAYNRILGEYDAEARTIYQKFRYASVCQTCIRRGLKRDCPHQAITRPSWHSERKDRVVKWMMRDNPEDVDREINGLEAGGTGAVFSAASVTAAFVAPRVENVTVDVSHVLVCVDPNNGKYDSGATEKSDFGIISGYRDQFGHWVMIGADAIPASTPEDYRARLIQHVISVRSMPHTRNATLVVIIENNTSDAQWIAEWIRTYCGAGQVIMKETELKEGVYTNHEVKKRMAAYTREVLDARALKIVRDFVCTGNAAEVQAALKKQMLSYAERHKLPNDPTGRVIVTLSGKDGAGGKDDLVVALQLMLYWGSYFFTSPKYAHWR